jgi:type II secretory pathway pseudopilin PulG
LVVNLLHKPETKQLNFNSSLIVGTEENRNMTALLKFMLNSQLKQKSSQNSGNINGFTLIELLVGLLLAFLVLTPLLGFMVNILDTDRKEQAKTTSEQEIQSALDYIARDLEQAVYIYDAPGLAAIGAQLPPTVAPTTVDGVPVLVFWKRQFIPKAFAITNDDAFVYSLVAYYLIKDSSCSATSTWSCAARIGRFQIKGSVNASNGAEVKPADPGFKRFDLTVNEPTLADKMNLWTKGTGDYTSNVDTLIDFVDQSTTQFTPPSPLCPTGTAVPDYSIVADRFKTHSFYACVDSSKTTAQVFLRGNSLARIRPKTAVPTYSASNSAYFPSANVTVKGRGLLGND